ncbi:MAG TPA: OmpA family protein [Reyranella sp.]|jgi:outer membrane protein OmpA-like peptidoglycan-associated protein
MKTALTSEIVVASPIDDATASRRILHRAGLVASVSLLCAGLMACVESGSTPSTTAPQTAAAPPPLPPILPFDQAVANAANTVFTAAPAGSYRVVIDPLVDGVTGYGSRATDGIQAQVTDLVQKQYPRFSIEKFSPDALKESPLVLVGTFTPVNGQNQTTGPREAYRFCLVLGDLKTGKVVAKGVARSQLTGVDATPTTVFRESPIWTTDPATQAYISTCQATKVGDPINKEFLDGLRTASLISQGDQAYNAGQYQSALSLYTAAKTSPAGDQLKAYNGIYLARWKLNQGAEASTAFGDAIAYGLSRNRLAVKFLFQPGSTQFYQDPQVSGQYPIWLEQIAQQTAQQTAKANGCIEVTGHTSRTGSQQINEQLSLQRANYVKGQLERDAPQLSGHLIANGAASSQMMVGTGKDDLSDALDRRVEFKPLPKCG